MKTPAYNDNALTLMSFINFCAANPHLRFWQALMAWSKADAILHEKGDTQVDTFYWQGRFKNEI